MENILITISTINNRMQTINNLLLHVDTTLQPPLNLTILNFKKLLITYDTSANQKKQLTEYITSGYVIDENMLDYLEKQKYPPQHTNIFNALLFIEQLNLLPTPLIQPNTQIFMTQLLEINNLVKNSETYIKSLPPAQIQAIISYSTAYFADINKCLRISKNKITMCGKCGIDECVDLIINGNNFFNGVNIPKLTSDVIVYRVLTHSENYKAFDIFDAMPIGFIMEDRTFMSTSLKFTTLFRNNTTQLILKIIFPKNTELVYIESISTKPYEKEVLMRPGISLKLIDKGTTQVYLRSQQSNVIAKMYTFICSACTRDTVFSNSPKPIELA